MDRNVLISFKYIDILPIIFSLNLLRLRKVMGLYKVINISGLAENRNRKLKVILLSADEKWPKAGFVLPEGLD